MRAFDQFLSENPEWVDKVVLVQICTSVSSDDIFGDSNLETIVDQINSKYGDIASGIQPIVLLKQDVKFEQYLALLSEADGFCVSCLRDGMNLTSHEFIYCNDNDRMGPLILSEFTGSAEVNLSKIDEPIFINFDLGISDNKSAVVIKWNDIKTHTTFDVTSFSRHSINNDTFNVLLSEVRFRAMFDASLNTVRQQTSAICPINKGKDLDKSRVNILNLNERFLRILLIHLSLTSVANDIPVSVSASGKLESLELALSLSLGGLEALATYLELQIGGAAKFFEHGRPTPSLLIPRL
ncbi:hypothetical protein FF38_13411 [Lucilia cuprina]|uniref:Uncharacterized protein n=1 Tax=Lucilia cuprina TaxID=7375 RepID=A0A0L0CEQ9_LUCCU|nr:hypothetical protein FF38_13411 [Lucilia cuprina]